MRAIKTFSFLLLFLLLSACGGGGGTSQTANEIAIDKIVAYANDASNPAPTVQDYIDAGVTGVNESNLADINAVVDGLEAEDVDTTAELEALTTQLNVNIVPTVNAGIDKTVQVNNSIEIIGTASDSDGTITSYEWTMGSTVLATTASFSYTPSAVGTDTLTLTVTDNDGDTASDSTDVVVTLQPVPNIAPTADAGDNKTVKVNHSVSITGTGIDTDGTIASYEWKLGSNVLSTTATFTYTPTIVGTDTLTLTVTDNNGATASADMDVVVVANVAPTANAGEDRKAVKGDAPIIIVGNASDSDGFISKYEWRRNGTFAVSTKNYSYSTTSDIVTTDTLTFIVTDNDGATASSEMKVLIGINIPDSARFLSFVNTGAIDANVLDGPGGPNETNALLYYLKIDPQNRKTTLEDWYTENCFIEPRAGYPRTPPECGAGGFGDTAFAIYLNNVDLNFGRRMALRSNSNLVIGSLNYPLQNTVSTCVENYPSIEQSITQTGLLATVCMEYSSADNDLAADAKKFTKFYTYGDDGNRITKVNLDGVEKYQPGMCLACHGGDPSRVSSDPDGDLESAFIPWDLDNFKFSTTNPLYSEANQEGEFRKLNQGAMHSYRAFDPSQTILPTAATEGAKATRELIRGWYSMSPGEYTIPENDFDGEFIPEGWSNGTQAESDLYKNVVAPTCRACHVQRGLSNPAAIDFATSAKFLGYSSDIYRHIYQQATMPLARRTFDIFWDNNREGNQAQILWDELKIQIPLEVSGPIEIPGKPIPKIKVGTVEDPFKLGDSIELDGRESFFTDTFVWSVTAQPTNTSGFNLNNNTSSIASFELSDEDPESYGLYTFRLTATNISGDEEFIERENVLIKPEVVVVPPLSFADDIKTILENNYTCGSSGCHGGVGPPQTFANSEFTWNSDGTAIYTQVLSKVSTGDAINSLLFKKAAYIITPPPAPPTIPAGETHSGGKLIVVEPAALADPPDYSSDYGKILKWIIDGAQP